MSYQGVPSGLDKEEYDDEGKVGVCHRQYFLVGASL